eukprot:8665166-Heterocapsa_arctica.AAC.1
MRRCDRGHRHGVTCGVAAKSSAYYTPYLVQIVGNAACGTTSMSSKRRLGTDEGRPCTWTS